MKYQFYQLLPYFYFCYELVHDWLEQNKCNFSSQLYRLKGIQM